MIYDSEKRLYLIMAFTVVVAILAIVIAVIALRQAGVNQEFIGQLSGVKL